MKKKRDAWIDYVKWLACFLVVLGHFFQSMYKANIIQASELFIWFDTSIYYFHVPLFFICSGVLYQKYTCVNGLRSWKHNMKKKVITLGIPYIVFTTITWVLKRCFSSSISSELGGLLDTLLIHPTAPYWYLIILLFIFSITPTFNKPSSIFIFLCVAGVLKILRIFGLGGDILQVYIIEKTADNWIWFVFGMMIPIIGEERLVHRAMGGILFGVFLILSVLTVKLKNELISFFMGSMACASIIMYIMKAQEIEALSSISKYTMPVFLMHTFFAFLMRVILLKIGITNVVLHIALGIIISFIGPIMAMKILELIKMDFLVYPMKILGKRNRVEQDEI